MLIPLIGVEFVFKKIGGELDLFVNYFVKIGRGKYHKIVIPNQH